MSIVCAEPLASLVALFEKMSPSKIEKLAEVYTPDVEFVDPIHQVRGIDNLKTVYTAMQKTLDPMLVEVIDAHGDDHTGFILWSITYRFKGHDRSLRGTTHCKFASDGRVLFQQDHWDASFAFYGDYPFLGSVMHWLRKRIKVA